MTSKIGIFDKSFDEISKGITEWHGTIEKLKGEGINPKDAKQQVGGLFSYIFKDNSKDKLVEEFETFKSMMTDYGMTAEEVAKDLGDELSPQIQAYVKAAKDGELTTEGFNASIGNLSLSAKAGKIALQGLAIAGNALLAFAVTEGINLLVKAIYNSIHATELAIEAAEKAQSKIDEIRDDISSMNTTVDDSAKKFAELSQGVDMISGKNLSLSTDDYNEFLKISNNLANLFPSLSRNYTENGDAIVQLSGDVDTIVGSLRNLLEVQENLKKQEIFEQMDDVYSGAVATFNKNNKSYNSNVEQRNTALSYIEALKKSSINDLLSGKFEWDSNNTIQNMISYAYKTALSNSGIKYGIGSPNEGFTEAITIDPQVLKDSEDEFNKELEKYVNKLLNSYNVELNDLNGKIAVANTDMKNSFSSYISDLVMYISDTDEYKGLNEASQKLASLLINSLTPEELSGKETNQQVKEWVQSNIINQLKFDNLTPSQISEINADFAQLFDMKEAGDITIVSFIEELQKKLKEYGLDIDITPIITDNEQALQNQYDKLLSDTKNKYVGNSINSAEDYKRVNNGNSYWDSWFDVNIKSQEDIDLWKRLISVYNDATIARQKYNEAVASQPKETIQLSSISETVDAVNTKLKPALDSLKTVYQSIFSSDGFTLDDVDVSMLESLKKSFEDLKENGIDIATEDFENFTRVITDSSTTSDEAQRAFNKLATTLVNNSKVTLVSDDAFNTLVQTLEQLGITNAEEALQGLRDIQSEIASKGYDLANITNEQAAAFINEGNASAEAVTYLQYYMIQKQLAEQPLSTVGDVESLENLCNTLGVTGEMLQEVINLKNMMNAVNAGAPTAEFMPRIEESKKKIAELAKGEFEYKFDFKPKLDSSKASGSAKDIAEEFKNLLDAELKVLDTKMDAGLINFNDYIVQRLALIQKYYDEGKIKASDYYDYLSKHYETQLSYMDKVTSYVTTRIDKEIDGYNKQIDQIKEKYQTEIDYLDTVIDYYEKQKEALQDANTQRELQLALQKALYDLEKAQTQRSRKIYADNHGYIFRADGDAIRDAQDNLNKAKLDIQINEIDKAIKKVQEQQDALKKAMDKEVEAINKIIENLEAYKEKWSSIAKEYEEKQNEMIAQQMLGADIEKEILAGRLDVLEDFKNKYLAIQQAIKDANANAAQAALNEANKPSTGGSGSGSGNGKKITTTPKSPLVSNAEKKRIQEENKKKKQRLTGGGTKNLVAKYANGTKNAEPGYHEIAENGDELIRDNYGNAYIAKGHQLHNFEGGETVYDAGDTKELLGGRLVPIESMPGISESLKNLMAYANTPDASQLRIQPNIPDYNMLKSVDSKSSTNSQVYVTQNVNVTLPNVTNEAGFNNFKKELDRLKLDAYQFANKRNK